MTNNRGFIGTIPLIIYTVCFVIIGALIWYFWGDHLPLVRKNLYQISVDIDTIVYDTLADWSVGDSDLVNEYRKEVTENDQTWVIVNRDLALGEDRLPERYQ
ncbi:MAG: hypothetical protein GF384_08230, partial [Elusimicrobia bacterium]|nr:hypothetical protein [Elusimicrobiota bacterium]MBD3412614.1 hypothetical protein [Elusimicrobiota bacterium]